MVAEDAGGAVCAQIVDLAQTPINHAPTDISLSNTAVNELQPSADYTVGVLSTADNSNGPFTYQILRNDGTWVNADADGRFRVVGNELRANGFKLDYEQAACTRSRFASSIRLASRWIGPSPSR